MIITPGKWCAEFDASGNCISAVYDVTYRQLLGYMSEEDYANAQQTWVDSLHPDDAERVDAHLIEVLKKHPEGMDYDIEYRMMTSTGYHWFHDYAHFIRKPDGTALRCDGVVFDIQDTADREKAENTLAQNGMRILALEDNFESLYDVEIDTGKCEVFIKGETYSKEIKSKLNDIRNYFEDLRKNIELVVYPDDRDELYEVLSRENLRKQLAENTSFDYYYRVVVNDSLLWFKIRAVYKDKDKKNVIIGVFNADEEVKAREKADALREELFSQMLGGESLFLIDCVNDTRTTIHDRTHGSDYFSDGEKLSESFGRYINEYVAEADREMMREVTDPQYMLKRTREEGDYSVRYRDKTSGIQRFYEMRIARFTDTEVLQSFRENDKEIVERMLIDKIKDEYFALFVVDLDAGLTEVVKNIKTYPIEEGTIVSYSSLLMDMAKNFEDDTKKFLQTISDIDYLKKRFAKDDKSTFTYRSHLESGKRWGTITQLVLARHTDGSPSMLTLGFSLLDEDASEKEQLQLKIKEALNVVGGLASEYTALYHIDLDTGLYKNYQATDRINDVAANFDRYPRFLDLYQFYINSEAVHPDYKKVLNDACRSEAALRKSLKNKKKLSTRFLRKYGDEYLWTEMTFIKCEEPGEEAHNVIAGFIEIDEEVKREQESQKRRKKREEEYKLIENIVSSYNVAFRVNMADDSYTTLRMDEDIKGNDEVFDCFTEAKDYFIDIITHPEDKERLQKDLDYYNIRKKLAKTKSYTVEYRALINGATLWHEMNITSIADDDVVISFAEKNLEITKRHLENKRYDEYLALFIVDLDTEMIQPAKTSKFFKTVEVDHAEPYETAMRKFADIYVGEARDAFLKMSNIEYVKQEFATEDKRAFSYKSTRIGGDNWIDVICYVTQRHDDGTPAMFTVGFSLVDALATVRQEIQVRLKEDMQMISGLASEYHALYYLNLAEKFFKVYSLDEARFPEAARIVEKGGDPVDLFKRFGRSDLVHPDDRHLFEEMTAGSILERLEHSKKFTTRFRRLYGSEYLWTEMDVIKYEETDEPANVIAVGFAERDAEIRSEQTLNNCFDVLCKEIAPYEAINELLSLAGDFYGAQRSYVFEYSQNGETIDNTYEWCAKGVKAMRMKLQDIPAKEVRGWIKEFKRQGAFYMDTLDDSEHNTPEGRKLLEMQGIESLIAAPIMNGNEIIGFIGVDNPAKARRNINVLKNISGVVFSEILKRKENDEEHVTLEKLTDTFMSVYYVDLARDYMHNWKIDKEYKEAYGDVKYYSVAMGGYVRENIADRDRERCITMTTPRYIIEQFKTKDRFSIDMTDIMLGYERNFVFDYVKVNEDGSKFVICCRDVTENLEKEREQALALDLANQQRHIKAFGDMVNAALWSMDINDDYEVVDVYWSDESRHMLGFTDESDFPNVLESWSERLHPDEKEKVLEHFNSSIRSNAADVVYDEEYRMLRKNNEYCWFRAVGRMENNDDGTRRLYGIIYDISADKRLIEQQKQLEIARVAAEAASKSKTSFLFNMSHDIRTPMNAITGFTNMAKKYVHDEARVKEYLDKIDTSGQQLLTLINQVLEMARIEAGKLDAEEIPLNILDEYNSMVTVLSEQAATNGLEFRHSINKVVHNNVLADKAKMSSITLNITGNAMKYTNRGGRIDFMLKEIASRKEGYATYVFTVADTGIGMSEEYLKVLFDPFTREKTSTVNKIQGTGLGMSIVKDYVELLGGEIKVASKLGKGTRFDITVDFKIDTDERRKRESELVIDEDFFKGKRTLVVEDNDLNMEIAVDILEEKGIVVETAEDGTIAVDILREKGPDYYDFILMDIQMPIMDGFEATREIRKMYPDLKLPIIALSANAFDEDRSASVAAGMNDHIAKPIHINELFRILAKYMM